MAAIILMMMAATFIGKLMGTEASFSIVYHNPIFLILWTIAAVCGLILVLSDRRSNRGATLMVHLAFALILVGALTTFAFGRKGHVHLLEDQSVSVAVMDNGKAMPLPFSITLESFDIDRYSGSMAASDYRSLVKTSDGIEMDISMNHIGKHKGYRFYQSGYSPENGSSTLVVSHDPAGVTIIYAGYLMLLLAMIGFFFQRDSDFRKTLRRISSTAIALLLLPQVMSAKSEDDPMVLPRGIAEEFGQLHVYYNDRIAPLQTMARDYCLKAYGKASWHGYTAEQVVTGWLFYYDWWQDVPFKLKAKDKGTDKEEEKNAIKMSVATGEAFKLFPIAFSDDVREANPGLPEVLWFSCDDPLPEDIDSQHWTFVRRTLDLIHEDVKEENWDSVRMLIEGIKKYQDNVAENVMPSPAKTKAERFYNRISRPTVPFMASVTLGIILFILAGIRISKGRRTPDAEKAALALLSATLAIYLTLVLVLRWYVSGHVPLAGSYSVMMLMAWMSAVTMTLTFRRFPLVQPLGFILSGFTMLVASLASANPQITHLMPVLQSPLLSIHVLSMMISYTLFGIVALNGAMGLAVPKGEPRQRLMDISLVILYPAVFLLTFGTFLGAVWANVSWGSYWAWDPKETWALITLLVYALALHTSSLKPFRNPVFFHWFCILAFATVLVTYFGVNLILGGMHSYA